MLLNKIVAYASNALLFVYSDEKLFDKIRRIYLFGSSVRWEFSTKKSDVDIFIDCNEKDEDFVRNMAELAISKFYKSNDFKKWKLLNIKNKLSIHSGNIDEWDLKNSILSEGILMYGKAMPQKDMPKKVLFTIALPKKKKEYLRITRKLYGRKDKDFVSKGIIEEMNGEKLATNAFIIEGIRSAEIIKILNKEKIDYKIREFFQIE